MCNSRSPETVSHELSSAVKLVHLNSHLLFRLYLFQKAKVHFYFKLLDGLLAPLISVCYDVQHSLITLCSEKQNTLKRLVCWQRGGARDRGAYYPRCGCSTAGTFTRQNSAEEADGAGAGRIGEKER